MFAKTYIKSVCNIIENLAETTLKNYGSLFNAGDHTEMDDTDILSPKNNSI